MKNYKKIFRNNWIEICLGRTDFTLQYSTSHYFDQRHMLHIAFLFFQIFLSLPIKSKRPESCEYPSYGISFKGDRIFFTMFWIYCGMKTKIIDLPWAWQWVRTSMKRQDGTWEHEVKGDSKNFYEEKWKGILWEETHPYSYRLESGEIQERTATIQISEREWRWKWFKNFKWPCKISRSIDVRFNDEVGERTGSWKGGCIGCGWDLREGQTPKEALENMMAFRKFE